jgi:glycosyltransferase involved in cell wall biosynthesis
MNPAARNGLRERLDIPLDAPVFLFIGRLNRDKGILDLAEAFKGLAEKYNSPHVVMVGPDEANLRETIMKKAHPFERRFILRGLQESLKAI